MAGHDNHGGSDMGAAFTGLIGGAILVGAILYAIVLWTNAQFAGHGEAKAHSSVSAITTTLV